MRNRYASPRAEPALGRKIPWWLILAVLAAMCMLIVFGIYIGLHSRVLGPEY